MNNLEETDRKEPTLRRKGGSKIEETQEKIAKRNLLERYKNVVFPKRSIDT